MQNGGIRDWGYAAGQDTACLAFEVMSTYHGAGIGYQESIRLVLGKGECHSLFESIENFFRSSVDYPRDSFDFAIISPTLIILSHAAARQMDSLGTHGAIDG